jgi:hypothetical protein
LAAIEKDWSQRTSEHSVEHDLSEDLRLAVSTWYDADKINFDERNMFERPLTITRQILRPSRGGWAKRNVFHHGLRGVPLHP